MEPHGQAPGPQKPYPPTPLGAEALRHASAKASVGHPPKHGRSVAERVPIRSYAFLHGQGHACTPKCVTARRRGLLRRRMKNKKAGGKFTGLLSSSFVPKLFFYRLMSSLPSCSGPAYRAAGRTMGCMGEHPSHRPHLLPLRNL